MADWEMHRQEYKVAFQESGINLKAWCSAQGINYQNARKHIKARQVQAGCPATTKTKRQNVIEPQPQKANRRSFKKGNQRARKHGAYAELLVEDDLRIALEAKSIDEELLVSRTRLVSIIKSRNQLEETLEDIDSHELRVQYAEILLKLVDAEDRTIARIESLHSTRSKLSRDKVSLLKDEAQTELTHISIEQRKALSNMDNKVTYHIEW
ncbi:hypothetical protein [Vibrio sinaloensis]|uniref:hypothetical protein n=1 Tax=Photobacterium sp. (strain ATCC 43367) TaxID=379097 RepID=UPI00204F5922|nr:hypothetical protein [Vibrio sinaloensis]UPQ87362.1 hypothetical protein MTO69_10055 [Vibrio sinaloensis]